MDSLTLEKAVKLCRAYEQSNKQVKEFRDSSNLPSSATKVNKVSQKLSSRVPRSKKSEGGNRHARKHNEGMKVNCNYCGFEHERSKEKCPAWGKTCDNCKGRNHFKSKCKKVHAEESVNVTLRVNEHDVEFQLDSAADVNTICQKHVRKHQVSPTSVRLNMWNKT